jgi:hypothetical protein
MDRGVFFFAADGRLLVRPDETGKIHEATTEDRRNAGRALRVPMPIWRRWVSGEENP